MSSTKPFSFETIDDFDEHIAKSIPNYHLLSSSICDLSSFFAKPETYIIDIGCSTGDLLKKIPFNGCKLGIDISANLLPNDKSNPFLSFVQKDIRDYEFLPKSSLILSIFTLQFLPRADRPAILSLIYDSLEVGGAFIMAEKVYEPNGLHERVMTNAYYDFKRQSFTTAEIMDKERDLRSMMSVQTSSENQTMVRKAGFDGFCFWKFYNFEGWVWVK